MHEGESGWVSGYLVSAECMRERVVGSAATWLSAECMRERVVGLTERATECMRERVVGLTERAATWCLNPRQVTTDPSSHRHCQNFVATHDCREQRTRPACVQIGLRLLGKGSNVKPDAAATA